MKLEDFPQEIQPYLLPKVGGNIVYQCIACGKEFPIDQLLYACPECSGILMLPDKDFDRLKAIPSARWRQLFDHRKMLNTTELQGIFLFHEFIAPVIPLDKIIYLGEGHTPMIHANRHLQEYARIEFYFKNEGQNPSASFKDRGLACAMSYINYLSQSKGLTNIITVCASTGDTSASAALYSSYLHGRVRSAVLLPHNKVTPQQFSQPLANGAKVFEISGVFDDCMKVIEYLAEHYNVALLNSKNAWRLRGQESFSFEIAQWFDYNLDRTVVIVPIGNAGNITAVMQGFIHFYDAGVINRLPKIIGVQTDHANPVYRYYLEPQIKKRAFKPLTVIPSVAQAAMIGNPVSMPRVVSVVEEYNEKSNKQNVYMVSVPEQEIIDHQILANRNGHTVCTQGGMTLAGLKRAVTEGLIHPHEMVILDATAHELKFSDFVRMYNEDGFPSEFKITPKNELKNTARFIGPENKPMGSHTQESQEALAHEIAKELGVETK